MNINSAIEKCQDLIRNIDGLTSADAFDEMIKILFVLMNNENIKASNEARKSFKDYSETNKDVFTDSCINLKDTTIDSILTILSDFDLFKSSEEVKGRTFEKFLGRTFTGDLGQFFTPKKIVKFITELTKEIIIKYNIDIKNVYDPSCGSGGFLVEFYKLYNNNIKYYGTDINPRIISVCKRNLLSHNITNVNIENIDFLDNNKDEFFDLILTNPPFGVKEKRKEKLTKFSLTATKKEEVLEIIFIEKIVKSLKPGGIAAIVLPDGILNNSSDINVRKFILNNCDLIASIDLPENTFKSSGTGCETSIIFLRKKTDKSDIKTFLFEPKEVGFERITKFSREIENNDLPKGINQFILNQNLYDISDYRFDAKYYLNKKEGFNIEKLCSISGSKVTKYEGLKKYIEFSNIDDFGFINGCDDIEYENLPSRAKILVKTGDIICARLKQSSDKIAIITEDYNNCIVSSGFVVIRPKDKVNPEFIISVLKSKSIQLQIKSKTTGSIMSSITNDEFMSIILPNIEPVYKQYNSIVKNNFDELNILKNKIREFNKEIDNLLTFK